MSLRLVSVILPTHNEEQLLEATVRTLVCGLTSRRWPFEIIVVENGSVDATTTIAKALMCEFDELRVLSLPQPDYGKALQAGFLAATGSVVVNFDVDCFDLEFLNQAVTLVEEPGGPVIVVGSKRAEGASDGRSWSRRLVTSVFSCVLQIGFNLKVSDTHGMKVMRREPLVALAQACRFGTDLFDTELVLRAERAGLPTTEIGVTVAELRPSRTSIASRIFRSLRNLAHLRIALWRERL